MGIDLIVRVLTYLECNIIGIPIVEEVSIILLNGRRLDLNYGLKRFCEIENVKIIVEITIKASKHDE